MCEKCKRFPAPTSNFVELGDSAERQSTLYQCKACGTLLEVPALGRGFEELSRETAEARFPGAVKK